MVVSLPFVIEVSGLVMHYSDIATELYYSEITTEVAV